MTQEMSVTIKYGKGYEESWAVFRADTSGSLKASIAAYFGLDGASVADLTLHELVTNVTNIAHGTSSAATIMGAVAIPAATAEAQASEGKDPWASVGVDTVGGPGAGAPEEPQGPNPMLAQIEAIADIPALQRLWAENQAAFADEEVMAAYKAKGKALQQAAA